ncbi:MAG: ATP-binding protein [Planctomycetota bacterium]|nr:ATP-binding protein [Planctomycetota bacterium]
MSPGNRRAHSSQARAVWTIGLAHGAAALVVVLVSWLLLPAGAPLWPPVAAGVLAALLSAVVTAAVWLPDLKRQSLLASAAARLVSGDTRHRVALASNGSLGSIADAMNAIAARLGAQEARLVETRNELEAILQSMEGGVLALDLQQRVLSMNRAAEWMLGLTDGQVRGRLLQEVTRQPELNRFVGEAFIRPPGEGEFALQGLPVRRVRATNSLLLDAEGKQVGLLVVLNDITQLRRLESVRSDFAANVSHELRTPITNIKGYVETLLDMDITADRDQSERFLRIIAKNADRLGAIVEDMLMLTQLERPDAKETLVTERTRLASVAEAVEGNLESELQSKSMALFNEVPDDLYGQINQQLVEQALSNLVMNAIRYSPSGTRIWVRATRGVGKLAREHVELIVVDEGPGIGEEHLLRIFERFYRIDKARSREQGGTGLGLAIVKHIVQLHAGRVDVDSAPGKGSTFRLILPAA